MNEAVVRLLEQPSVYLAWQRPFVPSKLSPVWRHNTRSAIRRVLDVGCGPGTNSAEFAGLDYLGVDLNPSYIAHARRKHDAQLRGRRRPHRRRSGSRARTTSSSSTASSITSTTIPSRRSSPVSGAYVSDDGHIHVIDLELPERRGIPRALALGDRGDYPRSLQAWRALLTEHFDEVVFEPFAVPARGPMLWSMVYFKGRPKPHA